MIAEFKPSSRREKQPEDIISDELTEITLTASVTTVEQKFWPASTVK
jgi:hypothetical protein